MDNEGDPRLERQTRLEWMIDEFRDARRRRLVKQARVVEPAPDTDAKAPGELPLGPDIKAR